jgi:hypothetical protein
MSDADVTKHFILEEIHLNISKTLSFHPDGHWILLVYLLYVLYLSPLLHLY